MDIEILKRNIEQVIMQPCMDRYRGIMGNGLAVDGKSIYVKVQPEDSTWLCRVSEGYVEEILERLPEKYRDKLVTLRHDDWTSCSYVPVFDTDTQREWDTELSEYLEKKAEWCRKYGCD